MVRPSLQERVENALDVLVGLPLSSMGRAADLEWFGFGRSRDVATSDRKTKAVHEWALHVQCAWRLTGPDGLVTGLGDLYAPADDPEAAPEGWSPFETGIQSRLDEHTEHLRSAWAGSPPMVEVVSADALGGLRLALTRGYQLEVWPDDSLPHEYWRLFEPFRDTPHFVVTGNGIEE